MRKSVSALPAQLQAVSVTRLFLAVSLIKINQRPRTAINTEDKKMNLQQNDFWQTQARGSNDSEYQIYLSCADNGNGIDFTTGKPLKTYQEWLNS
jgi:hypothetical protein